MNKQTLSTIKFLTILLSVLLAIVSYMGAFVEGTYEREVASLGAQGIGQDLVNLFFVVPVLLISFFLMQRHNKAAIFVYGGTVFYILYSFIVYCLGIHFNQLFILYCGILGLSFYLFIFFIYSLNQLDIKSWFNTGIPKKLMGYYLIIVALIFYILWLSDIFPAVINNTIPKSVSDYKLLVNPVHVIDLSIALPGLIISSILLIKNKKFGYIFAPVFLVFTIILTIALAAMVYVVWLKGLNEDPSIAIIFMVLACISSSLLFLYLKKLKA